MSANRRRFLWSVAAAPFLPEALALPESAASPEAPAASAAVPSSTREAPGAEGVAEALTDIVKRRFGAHLGEADLEEARKAITAGLEAAERLRAVKLGNADEPVTVFSAWSRAARPQPGERR